MRWTHFLAEISGKTERNSLNKEENLEEARLEAET